MVEESSGGVKAHTKIRNTWRNNSIVHNSFFTKG
jgi:hypothetical protein